MRDKAVMMLSIIFILSTFIITTSATNDELINDMIGDNSYNGDIEMINAFGDNYNQFIEDNWKRVEIASKIEKLISNNYGTQYPPYYGGMYISDDSKNLIVQIVKELIPLSSSNDFKIYNEIINIDDSIKVQYVNNSYSELNILNDEIVAYFDSKFVNDEYYANFISNYIDVINNSVVIELENNSTNQQNGVRKAILNQYSNKAKINETVHFVDNLIFKESKPIVFTSSINAGSSIAVHSGNCSMGFRTKYNGKKGYLTAAHCFKGKTPSIVTGTITYWKLEDNQIGDFAFVETNSNYTPTNNLAYTATGITKLRLVDYCPTIVPNMVVSKVGKSTQYTTGRVISTSVNNKYTKSDNTTVTIKKLVKASLKVNCGDSGGTVFSPLTDAEGGAIPLGIVSGGNPTDNCKTPGDTTLFTNINLLPTEMQTGRY